MFLLFSSLKITMNSYKVLMTLTLLTVISIINYTDATLEGN